MKLSDQQKIDIVKEYSSGVSGLQLSKKYNVSITAIFSILKRRNISIRGNSVNSRKYTLNENYFNKIDTEDKAYFLGLMYADGNVYSYKRNTCKIALVEGDKRILEQFNEFMNYSKSLKFLNKNKQNKNWQNAYQLDIDSKIMCKDLIKLGCVPAKSLILKFPTEEQVPKLLQRHFIRGYFDGDGSISDAGGMSVVSSHDFIMELSNICKANDIIYAIYNCKNPKTKRLFINRKIESLKFLDWIYKDATIYLDRKYQKYKNINRIYLRKYS